MKWRTICALALSLSLVHGSETLSESSFRIKDGLIWIHVTTPRSPAPLNFLLDSGANVSVINLDTARRLGVNLGARVSVRGVKSTAAGYWPQRLTASLAGVKLPQEYLALDLFFDSQHVQHGQHAWCDGFTDMCSGKHLSLDDHHRMTELCQSPGYRSARWPSAYHTDWRV